MFLKTVITFSNLLQIMTYIPKFIFSNLILWIVMFMYDMPWYSVYASVLRWRIQNAFFQLNSFFSELCVIHENLFRVSSIYPKFSAEID